ncbi:MAG: 3-deoxy-7-phosphoheptulonate synthase, partial [Fluviibacter sp.]
MNNTVKNQGDKATTDDVRIAAISELSPPENVLGAFPVNAAVAQRVTAARKGIHRVLHGADDRLVVVIGPCSVHDTDMALDYARRLAVEAERLSDDLLVVMRVYFEKPRTTVGWKGLINDPHLDNSFDINEGLRCARKLLLDVNSIGLPCATEFLDMITPQ